jgi:hypothetical protein
MKYLLTNHKALLGEGQIEVLSHVTIRQRRRPSDTPNKKARRSGLASRSAASAGLPQGAAT